MKIKSNSGMGTVKAGVLFAGGLFTVWLTAGCGSSDAGLSCGEGTVQKGNLCVVDSSTGGGGSGQSSSSSDGSSSSSSSSSASSSSGGPPPASNTPHDEFIKNVYPKLSAEGCVDCHVTGVKGAPKFLGDDAEKSYAAILNVAAIYTTSAESSLLTKGAHQGATALSAAGVTAAKKWLDLEFPPSSSGPPGPDGDVTGFNDAIKEFIRCMRQNDWEQNMKFYPLIQTNNLGNCAGCHEAGNAGTFLNADFNVTFKAMKTLPYVYRLVTAVFEGGKVEYLQGNDRLIAKGQATTDCFDPNNVICHDLYNVPTVQAQGLKNFQTSTLGRMQGLKCIDP